MADFPSRPIRLIVPFAPGGGTDIVGRTIGQKLTEAWKQPVVVENRAGGNGTIGANAVAKSPPDGYTLSMLTSSHSVNVSLQGSKHPYDLLKDLAPISQVTRQPYVLVANPRLPKSVQELTAVARANHMLTVYNCLVNEHDLRLVVLAAIICLLASFTAFTLLHHVRKSAGLMRYGWLTRALWTI